jgi:DNA (cytosine-5)-methyltransferase 1
MQFHSRFGKDEYSSITEPTKTLLTRTEWGLVVPKISPFTRTGTSGSVGQSADEPVGTIRAYGNSMLVTPTLIQYHGEQSSREVRGQSLENPLLTADAANRYGLVTSHLVKCKGDNIGQPVTEPVQTVTAGGNHFGEVRAFLIKYYGQGIGQSTCEPLRTITTHDRFGLVTVHGEQYAIVDIGLRMLTPRELFNAQGFPHDYVIDTGPNGETVSKAAQVARCGNAVPPPFAEALVRANLPEMCGHRISNMEQLKKEMAV